MKKNKEKILVIARRRKTMAVWKECHRKIQEDVSGEPYTVKGVRTVRRRVPGNLLQQFRKASGT